MTNIESSVSTPSNQTLTQPKSTSASSPGGCSGGIVTATLPDARGAKEVIDGTDRHWAPGHLRRAQGGQNGSGDDCKKTPAIDFSRPGESMLHFPRPQHVLTTDKPYGATVFAPREIVSPRCASGAATFFSAHHDLTAISPGISLAGQRFAAEEPSVVRTQL